MVIRKYNKKNKYKDIFFELIWDLYFPGKAVVFLGESQNIEVLPGINML